MTMLIDERTPCHLERLNQSSADTDMHVCRHPCYIMSADTDIHIFSEVVTDTDTDIHYFTTADTDTDNHVFLTQTQTQTQTPKK